MNLKTVQNRLAHQSYGDGHSSLDSLYRSLLPLTEHIFFEKGLSSVPELKVKEILVKSISSFVNQENTDEFQIGTFFSFNLKKEI